VNGRFDALAPALQQGNAGRCSEFVTKPALDLHPATHVAHDVALFEIDFQLRCTPMNLPRILLCALLLIAVSETVHSQQRTAQHRFDTSRPSVAPRIPEPRFPVLLENSRVRVLRVEIAANAETPMLPHEYDYLLVSIGATDLEIVGSSNRYPVTMQDGEMQVIPGRWAHRFVNRSAEPAHLVVIESRKMIKPDAPICGLAAPRCHETSFGKDGASEYDQSVLFETETVRLVKAELTGSAVLPKHEHDSDHLLVALTPMVLTADHENVSREAGAIYWHKGGFASLKNSGENQARFLIVELK
jgi:hypothetical protein